MGAGTVQYEGIDIPLALIYGPLPEGAAYWEVADLNGDGVPEVFAASTSTAGEETIYNVYDITEQGDVETTSYEQWQNVNVGMSGSGYGVDITCTLADGCSISLVPDYGFWLMIRHMFKAMDDYPTGGLDEAGMWSFFTEKLRQASNGDIDLDTFISDIENSGYPFNEAMRRRFIKQFENAQYNGLIERIGDVFATGDGKLIQEFFDKYENVGIANNTFILDNAFSLMNPSQIMDRMILGDGDVGITVDICSSTVTTNCVDPTAIKDLWEDFGRHIRVIFKGLEIPGLPEWLPLPGIIRIPTIGEIWDKVIGPFNDAADQVLDECMDQDDDGDGYNNSYSYCLENRDYAAIITKGILDGSGKIIDATTEAVKGIVDKALETLDCVTDPAACAGKIKDVLEGVLGGADPTQPGLPPWMRVIIIGGQYGDEILKELEKIFNEDIDGDGVIGIDSTQVECWDGTIVDDPNKCPFDCTTIGKINPEGGAASADDCEEPTFDCTSIGKFNPKSGDASSKADCVDPCSSDPSISSESEECVTWVDTGPTQEQCAKLGRVHVPGDATSETPSTCGGCQDNVNTVPEDENDPMSPCVAPDPLDPNEGDPCNTGAPLNAEGKYGPAPDYDCIPNEGTTCNDPETGKEGNIENGVCVVEPDSEGIDCTQPRPTGTVTFDLIDAQGRWDAECKDTHCPSGVPITEDPDCYGQQSCENNAVNYPDCNQCENGEHPDAHVDSDCSKPLKETGTNPGDACDLGNDEVGVVDKNGDCKRVGQNCQRSQYGYTSADNCETGLGFYTSGGIIDSNGDCVCNTVCDDPNRQVSPTTGACRDDCRIGWKKDAEGKCTVEDPDAVCDNGATLESECKECPKGQEFSTVGVGPRRCVVKRECKEDDAYTDPTKAEECGKVECPPDSEKPYADSLDQCVPITSPQECTNDNGDPSGAENYPACDRCPQGQYFNESGICVDNTTEECVTPDGTATGAIPPNCSECPTGQDFDTNGICVDTVLPEVCNDPNAVNNGQDGPCECKPGFTKNAEGLCFQGDELCENGATKESGCDTCPDGTSVIEYEDGICPGPVTTCDNGATDFPACTTCPEGQSMDDSGNCVGGPDDGGTDGGSGGGGGSLGGGGGGGMMTGISGYMGDPQLLSRTEFPITDFLAGLFSNLRGK